MTTKEIATKIKNKENCILIFHILFTSIYIVQVKIFFVNKNKENLIIIKKIYVVGENLPKVGSA